MNARARVCSHRTELEALFEGRPKMFFPASESRNVDEFLLFNDSTGDANEMRRRPSTPDFSLSSKSSFRNAGGGLRGLGVEGGF